MNVDSNVKVRPFRVEDAGDIVRIHGIAGKWFEEKQITREFVHAAAARADFRFFVAEAGGRAVGFCGILYYESVGRGEVGPISVDPAFAGRGAGTSLLEYAIRFLKEKNIHRVIARIKDGNKQAKEFFQAKGFTIEARLKRFTRAGEDAIQYVRLI